MSHNQNTKPTKKVVAKKPVRAKPRHERVYPQVGRVYSTNYMNHIIEKGGCFVPLEDYRKLERKYLKLFNRISRNKESV